MEIMNCSKVSSKLKVRNSSSIRDSLRQMDKGGIGFCVTVDDEDTVTGILTDGDFRRAILNGVSLSKEVNSIENKDFLSVSKEYTKEQVENIFNNSVAQQIPIIENGKFIGVITEEFFYNSHKPIKKKQLNNSVVIMAGGKGTRLDPFTRILPKPLIPIGDKPIIKVIMDNFNEYGMKNFYISVNDKSRMIKSYFHDHDLDYSIDFIEENKPLGTAGSLKNINGKLSEPFFVSNCDIIINCDLEEVLNFHNDRGYDLTLIGSMQHYTIPYGVCEIDNGGDLVNIQEKPEFDYLTNTGVYIVQPEVLDLIPNDTYFDMVTLIEKLQKNKFKVGVFPISSESWSDAGQWLEYEKTSSLFPTSYF